MEKQTTLDNISDILKILWLYIAGIIATFTMYFLLTAVDQGIDVVIQAGEKLSSGIYSIIAVVLWSYLIWYSCRLLSYTKQTKEGGISTMLLQLIPRLLAFNCFVCVQVSIFALPTFYEFSFWHILGFVLLQNFYYFLLHQWFTNKKTWAAVASGLFMVLMLGVYVYIAGKNYDKCGTFERHKFWLPFLGIVLFILQTLATYGFINRRRKIDSKMAAVTYNAPLKGKLSRLIGNEYMIAEKGQLRFFMLISLLALIINCGAVFSISVAGNMGPLAFVMLALSVMVGVSNIISFFSVRLKINLFLFIFILAMIIGKFQDPYVIRTIDPVGKSFYEGRPSVKAYLYRWVKKREKLIDKYIANGKKFDAYIVLSDGGASRAGNWVCSVLSSLEDSSIARDSTDVFSDHLLAIAGASGGSVGNAAFYGMLRARQEDSLKGRFSGHAATFFKSDFLTFTLARLAGPDLFRHIFPIHSIMDRGAALETVLATGSDDPIIDTQLSRPLSAAFDTSGELPIFFITTTRVQDGMPCILSSTQLPENSQRKDVTHLLDTMGTDIRFATAAILSSRFPYVSPAGNLRDNYFVDGGYVDNAGSGIMLDFLERLSELAQEKPDTTNDTFVVFKKIWMNSELHVLHIYNSPDNAQKFSRINPLANDIITPVLTLAGMQGSSTLIYTATLKEYFEVFNHDTDDAIINYSLYDANQKNEETYPMSWVISGYQLERMHRRVDTANMENKNLFWFLRKKP